MKTHFILFEVHSPRLKKKHSEQNETVYRLNNIQSCEEAIYRHIVTNHWNYKDEM